MSKRPIADLAEINPPLRMVPRDQEIVGFVPMSAVSESGQLTEIEPVSFGEVKAGFTRFQDNDVLFAKITPCMENGKGALVRGLPAGVGCGSTEFHVLRAKPNNDAAYVFQLMQWARVRQSAERFMSGSAGQQRVLSDFFFRYEVYAPSEVVQKKIAEVLQTTDRVIESTEALIEKYQQIKAGLMHDLFTRGIGADGKLRPPREQAPDLYQQTPIGWMPKEWQYELLDKLAIRGSGHTPNKNFPEYWNGGIKWISLADSFRLDRLYIHETEYEISQLGIQNSSAVVHPTGVVVLSRDAGVGKSAITTAPMAVSQHFMCWRCGELLDNYFLYYWLQFKKRMFENIAMGSTILTIGLPYFKRLKIGAPRDLSEQQRIGDRLRSADTKLFALEKELNKLKQQKAGLMHDLLTGERPVNVTAEPAKAEAHV